MFLLSVLESFTITKDKISAYTCIIQLQTRKGEETGEVADLAKINVSSVLKALQKNEINRLYVPSHRKDNLVPMPDLAQVTAQTNKRESRENVHPPKTLKGVLVHEHKQTKP